MEDTKKWIIIGVTGLLSLIFLLILGFNAETPSLTVTVSYPSLVFKPGEFNIGLSIKNIVSSTVVKNKITISSGKIVQLDNIPSDCEQLTDEERICDESLSFKVTNETSSGAHRISFMIDSVSYLNYPILRNYLKYSSGNSFLEVPINVQTPAVDILQSQSEVNYSKTGLFWVIGFLLVIVVSLLVGLILFAPQLWEFFKEFI